MCANDTLSYGFFFARSLFISSSSCSQCFFFFSSSSIFNIFILFWEWKSEDLPCTHWVSLSLLPVASRWCELYVIVMCYCNCLYFQFSLSEVYFVVRFIHSFRKLSDSRLDPIGCIHKDRLFRSHIRLRDRVRYNIDLFFFLDFFLSVSKSVCVYFQTTIYIFFYTFSIFSDFGSVWFLLFSK